MDQSIDECQETLMMIEGKSGLSGQLAKMGAWPILKTNFKFHYLFKVYRHEFIELKKLLELKQEYDFDNNNGKNSMRGISWEVRKTSPGPRKHSTDGINETKIR